MANLKLALKGGKPIRDTNEKPWPSWPVWDEAEEKGLLSVLHSGTWSYNGSYETAFNRAFAKYIGTQYSICASNGTVTLQMALEALEIGLGDEVIVPGITWQATAATIIDVNAIPILVDVCEDTWCLDPQKVRKAITPRTKAIIPVHLYGCFVDMDEIMAIAKEFNLSIIEDSAHKHGGEWRGKKAGSIGDIGSFSFQLSKLLTAGEGGAVTTNNATLAEKLDALRNCGRRPENEDIVLDDDKSAGHYNDDGHFIQSGNYRITEFQAVLLLEGLKRLPEQNALRDENAQYLNARLLGIDGVEPMRRDKRETKEAYFNYSFRYDQKAFGNLRVDDFRKALTAEIGFEADACYQPLNQADLYVPHTKPSRHKLNEQYWSMIDPARFSLPISEKVFHETSVCMHHSLLMGAKPDMDQIIEAIEKIRRNINELL